MGGKEDEGEDDDVETDQNALNIFQEPAGYFKPKDPFTFAEFELAGGRTIPLRLVGESPLWAHHLWNGAKILTDHLQQHASTLVKDRTILELGAGAGLPSLVCAMLGAKHVLVTDYPDPELIENLQYNIAHCPHLPNDPQRKNVTAMGYLWGAETLPLLDSLPPDLPSSTSAENSDSRRFNTLLLADILYNHSEHRKLVQTIRSTLARAADARALVFFTPYRPWLLDRDMAFFDLVKTGATTFEGDNSFNIAHETRTERHPETLAVERICERMMPKTMFENDRGDETLRRTVFGYEIFWADLQA